MEINTINSSLYIGFTANNSFKESQECLYFPISLYNTPPFYTKNKEVEIDKLIEKKIFARYIPGDQFNLILPFFF